MTRFSRWTVLARSCGCEVPLVAALAGLVFVDPDVPWVLDQPFWLDPSDRHHMAAVMQAQSRPLAHNYALASGDLRHDQIYSERVWAKAIHRIVTENISPEQAVDEAIARIKQILSE